MKDGLARAIRTDLARQNGTFMMAADEPPWSKVIEALDLTGSAVPIARSANVTGHPLMDKPGHLRRKRPEGHVVADESSRYPGLLLEGQEPRQGWTEIQASQPGWSFEAQRLQQFAPAKAVAITHSLNPTGQALAHLRQKHQR